MAQYMLAADCMVQQATSLWASSKASVFKVLQGTYVSHGCFSCSGFVVSACRVLCDARGRASSCQHVDSEAEREAALQSMHVTVLVLFSVAVSVPTVLASDGSTAASSHKEAQLRPATSTWTA